MTCVSSIALLIGNKADAAPTYPQLIYPTTPSHIIVLRKLMARPKRLTPLRTSSTPTLFLMWVRTGTFPELGQPGIDTNCVFMKSITKDSSLAFHNGDIDIPYSPLLNPANPDGTGTPFSAEIWLFPSNRPAPLAEMTYRSIQRIRRLWRRHLWQCVRLELSTNHPDAKAPCGS